MERKAIRCGLCSLLTEMCHSVSHLLRCSPASPAVMLGARTSTLNEPCPGQQPQKGSSTGQRQEPGSSTCSASKRDRKGTLVPTSGGDSSSVGRRKHMKAEIKGGRRKRTNKTGPGEMKDSERDRLSSNTPLEGATVEKALPCLLYLCASPTQPPISLLPKLPQPLSISRGRYSPASALP